MNILEKRGAVSQWGESQILISERGYGGYIECIEWGEGLCVN